MPHTRDALVYDPDTMILQMIVIPADDDELNDPAFNPPGAVQLRIDRLDAGDDAQEQTRGTPRGNDQPIAVALTVIDRAMAVAADLGVSLRLQPAEVEEAIPADAEAAPVVSEERSP